MKNNDNPYMYLFVREDLSQAQQIVQAAHAVDELNKKHLHDHGNYMVLCSAINENHLLSIAMQLVSNGIIFKLYFEPDIDAYTAIATQPLRGHERKPLKKFKLKK